MNTPATYRSRSQVTAVRWTGPDGCEAAHALLGHPHPHSPECNIGNSFSVHPGEWIVRLDVGRYRVLSDSEFHTEYEAVPVPTKPTLDPADPIINLDLTIRTYNRLRRDGIDTVGQLAGSTADKLMDIRGFGIGCLNDVVTRLGAHGFKLAGAGVAHRG